MVMVNKKFWLGAAAFALALAAVLPGSVSAATVKCPDYSGKVVTRRSALAVGRS